MSRIDTIRVLVSWRCNLSCSYCCNKLPGIRAGIRSARLEDLDFTPYKVVCITGEPLLCMDRVQQVCARAKGKFIVLYTNGLGFRRSTALSLLEWGVNAVNVGLHKPESFNRIIARVNKAVDGLPLPVRFDLEDIHEEWAADYLVPFHFWHRDECERGNEDRVVLED